jgi:hypothetical protein
MRRVSFSMLLAWTLWVSREVHVVGRGAESKAWSPVRTSHFSTQIECEGAVQRVLDEVVEKEKRAVAAIPGEFKTEVRPLANGFMQIQRGEVITRITTVRGECWPSHLRPR